MNQELWKQVEARVMAIRTIRAAMLPLDEDDRRSVLLDALLEFAPEMFALLQNAERVRQERDHYREKTLGMFPEPLTKP